MGPHLSVQVRYKSGRGGHAEGKEVKDAKDWFETLLNDDYQNTRNLFLAAPVEAQQAIIEVLDG